MCLQKYCLSISFAQNLSRMNYVIRDLPWRLYFLFFLPDLETQNQKYQLVLFFCCIRWLRLATQMKLESVCIMIQCYFTFILNSYAVLTLGDIRETADKWFSNKNKDREEKGERGGGQVQCEGSDCYCKIQCERSRLPKLCTVFCLSISIDSFPFSFPFVLSPLVYSVSPSFLSNSFD